jgi:3-oxoacyl-[acyl-carrier-protein] synthase II
MENYLAQKRVVVTGMGVVTSLGNDIETFFGNLLAGKSGVDHVSAFDVTDFPCRIGSEVKDFVPTDWMDHKEVRRNDRYVHLGMAASKLAVAHAKLDVTKVDSERMGVLLASGIGGLDTIEKQSRVLFERGPRRVSPFMIPSLIANMASGVVAIEFGAKGPNFSIVSACSSSTHAIGESMRILQTGDADIMIAGGSEAAITSLGYAGFCSMKAMSTRNDDPQRASRPFEKSRDGFVMGEGAGILILETLEHAQARGATIYCELGGYAASCDAFHITQPDAEGLGLSMAVNNALKKSGVVPEEVDYVNAHGTSTPYNDRFETVALRKVFGDSAKNVLVSSTKSMTGHLLGAAGAIEAVVCAKVIETGEIPPTINYDEPDPECDLNYVPNTKVSRKVRIALSNNSGFGGHNATLLLREFRA